MNEEWRPVVGYKGWYSVSSLGRVRRDKPVGKVLTRILKPRKGGFYLTVSLWKKGIFKGIRIHKLVTQSFLGDCPRGKNVNHKNGKRFDNRIENLEYVTPKENSIHASKLFLLAFGSRNKMAKLNEKLVIKIRKEYSLRKCTQRSLCRKYNVEPQTMNDLLRRITWKHI